MTIIYMNYWNQQYSKSGKKWYGPDGREVTSPDQLAGLEGEFLYQFKSC